MDRVRSSSLSLPNACQSIEAQARVTVGSQRRFFAHDADSWQKVLVSSWFGGMEASSSVPETAGDGARGALRRTCATSASTAAPHRIEQQPASCPHGACIVGASGTLSIIATNHAMPARYPGAMVIIKPVALFMLQMMSLWVQLGL